jgi:agmatine/peptidylarginine deiminase
MKGDGCMVIPNECTTNDKRYTHLSEQDLEDGKALTELLEGMDEQSKKLAIVYARGLRDMQDVGKVKSA